MASTTDVCMPLLSICVVCAKAWSAEVLHNALRVESLFDGRSFRLALR
jgi:hypothetical protein